MLVTSIFCSQHFLLFSQGFKNFPSMGHLKPRLFGKALRLGMGTNTENGI